MSIKLYINQFLDTYYCETCGSDMAYIYSVHTMPYSEDDATRNELSEIASFGVGASCFGGSEGSLQECIDFINEKYNVNINLDDVEHPDDVTENWQDVFDKNVFDYVKEKFDIELYFSYNESDTDWFNDDDDDYDDGWG